MRIFVGLIFFLMILSSGCGHRLAYQHYKKECIEVGDDRRELFLFDNDKFYFRSRFCDRYLPASTTSIGTYKKLGDSAFVLTSTEHSLALTKVIEYKDTGNVYEIQLLDHDGQSFLNESVIVILNGKDTIGWGRMLGFSMKQHKKLNSIQVI